MFMTSQFVDVVKENNKVVQYLIDDIKLEQAVGVWKCHIWITKDRRYI